MAEAEYAAAKKKEKFEYSGDGGDGCFEGCGCIVQIIIFLFIVGGIIGIALFGWDKLIEKLKDWF